MNTEYVKLLNDTIKVDTGMDWVAIFAFIISVVALIWQWKARKKDIQLQKWTAVYPHRLEFYDNFSKELNDFYSIQQNALLPDQIKEYKNTFIKYQKEAEILFDKVVVDCISKIVNTFQKLEDNLSGANGEKRRVKINNKELGPEWDITLTKNSIKKLEVDEVLRKAVMKEVSDEQDR